MLVLSADESAHPIGPLLACWAWISPEGREADGDLAREFVLFINPRTDQTRGVGEMQPSQQEGVAVMTVGEREEEEGGEEENRG